MPRADGVGDILGVVLEEIVVGEEEIHCRVECLEILRGSCRDKAGIGLTGVGVAAARLQGPADRVSAADLAWDGMPSDENAPPSWWTCGVSQSVGFLPTIDSFVLVRE